jgi:(4S)-4-hydroxy-5-phosphonooxypentane-2,3-dione isomerase
MTQAILLVEFLIHRAHVADFDTAIRANAQASLRTEVGCRQFDVCTDPANPQRFVLYEIYDNEAAVQAHLQAPHFLAMSELSGAWVQHKTVQRLLLEPVR